MILKKKKRKIKQQPGSIQEKHRAEHKIKGQDKTDKQSMK